MSVEHITPPAFMGKWSSTLLAPDHDTLWKEWVDTENLHFRHLAEFVEDPEVRNDAMKARAILILITPDLQEAIIPWKLEKDAVIRSFLQGGPADLSKLNEPLLRFAGDVLIHYGPGFISKLVLGDPVAVESMDSFYGYIRQLLGLLPIDEQTEQLYAHYGLRDPASYSWSRKNAGEPIDYRPFNRLLLDTRVPEHWKVRADAAIQAIMLREFSFVWQSAICKDLAFRWYMETAACASSCEPRPYSLDLLKTQMRFILDHHDQALPGWEKSYRFPEMWDFFSDPEELEIRRKIAFLWYREGNLQSGWASKWDNLPGPEYLDRADAVIAALRETGCQEEADQLSTTVNPQRPRLEQERKRKAKQEVYRTDLMRRVRGESP